MNPASLRVEARGVLRPVVEASVTRVLTGPEIRALSGRSDLRGAGRTALHGALLLGAGWAVAVAPWWALLPAMVALGIVQAALFAVVHETVHLTAFRTRRVNEVVGWVAACPSLLNWHFYMAFHMAHHRHTQDPARDPEMLVQVPRTLQAYVGRVLAVPYWRTRVGVAWDGLRGDLSRHPYVPPAAAAKIVRSIRGMLAAVVGVSAVAVAVVGWWAPLVFWIGPQLLGQPFLRLYLLTEHTGCSEDDDGLTNTRTVLTVAPVRVLMWNMGFHAEHHLVPSIPFHRLPDAHRAMRSRLGVVQDGYARWHVAFVRGLRA